jgi:N-methylhydantoinase A/acetone carboxylase, beta subunit
VNLRVTATIEGDPPAIAHEGAGDAVVGSREVMFLEGDTATSDADSRQSATVYDRSKLAAESTIAGPAILEQAESTTVVPPGWRGRVRTDGALVMQRTNEMEGDR